jgi:hypothetical protein
LTFFKQRLRFEAPRYNSTKFMETAIKTGQLKTTDTLRQALSTLAALMDRTLNEVSVLDTEIQDAIGKAVSEAQETLQKQAADRLQYAVEEAEQKTRAALSEEHRREVQRHVEETARAHDAVSKLREEHAKEMSETEEAAAIALERQAARAVERVRSDLEAEIASLKSELERANQAISESKAEFHRVATEKESLLKDGADKLRKELEQAISNHDRTKHLLAEAELANSRVILEAHQTAESVATAHQRELDESVERVRSELTEERDRVVRQLDELLHSAAQWDAERASLKAELKRVLAESEQAMVSARKEAASQSSVSSESLKNEVRRVEESIHNISAIIDAPETELSLVIRKNVERAELEAYLKGIKFVVSGK